MKILNIITSLGDGGAEATLCKILSANKNHHDHFVICLMGKGKYGEKLINEGSISNDYLNNATKKEE